MEVILCLASFSLEAPSIEHVLVTRIKQAYMQGPVPFRTGYARWLGCLKTGQMQDSARLAEGE